MNKATYYAVFIICTTIVLGFYVNFLTESMENRQIKEKIVYTIPQEANLHQKIYHFDEDTYIIVVTLPKKKKKK